MSSCILPGPGLTDLLYLPKDREKLLVPEFEKQSDGELSNYGLVFQRRKKFLRECRQNAKILSFLGKIRSCTLDGEVLEDSLLLLEIYQHEKALCVLLCQRNTVTSKLTKLFLAKGLVAVFELLNRPQIDYWAHNFSLSILAKHDQRATDFLISQLILQKEFFRDAFISLER